MKADKLPTVTEQFAMKIMTMQDFTVTKSYSVCLVL